MRPFFETQARPVSLQLILFVLKALQASVLVAGLMGGRCDDKSSHKYGTEHHHYADQRCPKEQTRHKTMKTVQWRVFRRLSFDHE